MVSFTEIELRHISISVLALVIAVSGIGFLPLEDVGYRIAVISIPLALGFTAHELVHKLVAVRYGYFGLPNVDDGLGIRAPDRLGLRRQASFRGPRRGHDLIAIFYPTSERDNRVGRTGYEHRDCQLLLPFELLVRLDRRYRIVGHAYQPLASIFQLATLPATRRGKSLLVEPRSMDCN